MKLDPNEVGPRTGLIDQVQPSQVKEMGGMTLKRPQRARPCDSSIMESEFRPLQVLGLPRLHGKTLIQRGPKDLLGKGSWNSLQSQGNNGGQDFPFLLEQGGGRGAGTV